MKRHSWVHGLILVSCANISANNGAPAQQAAINAPFLSTLAATDSSSSPTSAATTPPASPSSAGATRDLDEIVVHGIRRGDLILPTTVTSKSAYGIDLDVMDTPRNTTAISQAQLSALNI